MSKPIIYIDGQQGSTGLRIRELLDSRTDIELRLIPESRRRDSRVRAQYLNEADLSVLCLPDDAAVEALQLIASDTRVIDTSTARRIHGDWVYGLPELAPGQREAIGTATRVANPGCYPVGFLLAVRPLIEAGALPAESPLTVNAVSGYSGGGGAMIETYQSAPRDHTIATDAPIPLSLYSLGGAHKHVPEMHRFSLAAQPPLFVPSVDHSYCGMVVSTPIAAAHLATGVDATAIWEIWQRRYGDEPFVRCVDPLRAQEFLRDGNFLDLGDARFTNRIDLFVFGDERGVVLIGRQDNLGKGASGNAVQCLNLMLGFSETTGLAVT